MPTAQQLSPFENYGGRPGQRHSVRHHTLPRAIDLHESRRVGGRVHAVVRRGVEDAESPSYWLSRPAAHASV
jgi:hypothetical protein